MSEKQQPTLDLSPLENDYTIVGEGRASSTSRNFTATRKDAGSKRRDDLTGVQINVVSTPKGDEGNAVAHVAADTKLLSRMQHRRLIPVIEGRWLGNDAFAVVTQRINDATLADKLASRETFTNPRVAAILREVNGLLEWAREQNVVHRHVTPGDIYLEPKTDRVRVRFGVAPISRLQTLDAETEDARTIVRLALAMLTGVEDPKVFESQSLLDLRSDLPKRLCEATTELLDESRGHTASEITSYLSMIGMADPLFLGEEEEKRIRADVLEEQRVEREKLANERADFERQMAEQRATFEKSMSDERAKFDKALTAEREKLEKERAELTRAVASERDKHQRAIREERASLEARRTELERVVAEQRAQMEKTATEDRRAIEKLRSELKHAGEVEIERKREAALAEVDDAESTLDDEIYAAPGFVPPTILPLEDMVFDDDTELMRDERFEVEPIDTRVDLPVLYEEEEPVVATADVPPVKAPSAPTPGGRKKWIVPVSVAVIVAAIGGSAIVLGSRSTPTQPVVTPVPAKAVAAAPAPVPAALPPSLVPLPPTSVQDSSAGSIAARTDSLGLAAPVVPKPKPKPKPRPVDSAATVQPKTFGDSLFNIPTRKARADTVVKPDTGP
ncbi:MAG: hypothetical protein ABIY52_01440 [Gemmatimonadaceae bacterium]